VEVTHAGALARSFTRILEELHSQYLLPFVPTAGDGRVHQIEVVANDKKLQVRARRSYLAAAAASHTDGR
jgi:hypothetical protein